MGGSSNYKNYTTDRIILASFQATTIIEIDL